ncbi:flavodoxin domain-containing protein [Bacillus sp. FJAT-22090]|uniref:flavodoxin domain-containing protein n=1 Tax=Bacillus sp. FJAT-22090 TaxID=1581038 RepID=UPI0011AB0911|nr:flavodoxin domain-containing protein [Bacillus sp. FJAT-22090]
MIKVAIVYLTFSGNTRDLATLIKGYIEEGGHQVHLFSHKDDFDLSEYDYVLFGSLTWEIKRQQGKLPIPMRKMFKKILIEEPQKIKRCSLFGTGETQWGEEYYCRAVDEMEYHLQKHGIIVDCKLKIEQNPKGKENKVKEYTNEILEVIK